MVNATIEKTMGTTALCMIIILSVYTQLFGTINVFSQPYKPDPIHGGTIVIEQAVGAETLDPADASTAQSQEATQQVYQALVAFSNNSTEKFIPLLAQNYLISPDGLTYTFNIRKNITFSNGDPLNAYVFWYSIYRSAIMLQSQASLITAALDTTGVTAGMLNQYTSIPPSQSLIQIMRNPALAISVTAPYTLVFHLHRPFAPLMAMLTQPPAYAVDPVVVYRNGGIQAGNPNSWMNSHAVGTGPFVITRHEANTVTIYDKNPKYWGGADGIQLMPYLDRVISKVVPDSLTRLQDVELGSAQLAYIDFSLTPQVKDKPQLQIVKTTGQPTIHNLALDTQKFPLNNVLIRKAIAHAIKITDILKLYQGFAGQFVGPVPKGVLGYSIELNPYNYNASLAKQLLAQSGHPDGKGLPTLSLLFAVDRPPSPEGSQIIQANLADIGLKINLKGVTGHQKNAILSNTKPNNLSYPDMVYAPWQWFPDPWAFANWWIGPANYGLSNIPWYNNTQVNMLLKKADMTNDPQQRAMMYRDIGKIVYEDVPFVWLAQFNTAFLQGALISNIKLKGFISNPYYNGLDFSTVYFSS